MYLKQDTKKSTLKAEYSCNLYDVNRALKKILFQVTLTTLIFPPNPNYFQNKIFIYIDFFVRPE